MPTSKRGYREMLEVTRFDGRQKVRGTLMLSVGFLLIGGLYIGLFPSIEQSGVDFSQYLESLPEGFQSAFAVESISTIEGFLAIELYQFIWLLLFGIYAAYSAGGLIAGEIEDGSLDLVLATPITRVQLLLEKLGALMIPIMVPNMIVPIGVGAGVLLIGESLSLFDLFMVHLLSIPYLLTCAGMGLLLSVVVDRATIAQRGAIVLVFMLFLVETISTSADYDWLGAISPTRYYDPAEILVDSTYDIAGGFFLLAAALVLVLVSAAYFRRRDIN